MMNSRFASDEMGHNPQAPGPAKKQAHSCWRKNPGRDYDLTHRRFYRSNAKPESCEGTIDGCLACRINGLSELGSLTREILQCLWGWPSVRMRDSLNHIQGNDLGAGWIDHHTDLLLLFALLYGMVNLSDLPIVERRRSKPCLNCRMI